MKKGLFAAGLFLCFFVLTAAAGKPAVILNENDIYVSKKKIYLSDVAALRNISGKDAEKLRKIYLKRAAVPGRSVRVTKNLVRNKVRKHFRYIGVEGKKFIKVHTEAQVISRQKIEKKAREYIKGNMPWEKGQAQIKIKPLRNDVKALNGKVLLKVKRSGNADFKGSLVVPVEIFVNGKFYRIVPVTAVIEVKAGCLTAAGDIERRQRVTASMIKKNKMDITNIPGAVVTDIDSIKGKIAKRGIRDGAVLKKTMFETPPVFRRGDKIGVVVFVDGIAVESHGEALETGRPGEEAKVKLVTGKTVSGKVSKNGKVFIIGN